MKKFNLEIDVEEEELENENEDINNNNIDININNNNKNNNNINNDNNINNNNINNNNNNNNTYEEIKNFYNGPFKNSLNEEYDISYNKWITQDKNLKFLCSDFPIPNNEEIIKQIIKRRDYPCELKLLKWITEDNEHKQNFTKISNSKTKLNRHNDILPYKYNNVTIDNNNNNNINIDNYINASYIDGPLKEDKKLFIATQGPLSGTIFSFWKMIISHNINLIIMLSNVYEEGREKSECYWPTNKDNNLILYKDNDNEKKDINDKIVLKLVNEEILENNSIVKRTFKLNELKEINQIQILCWGDHDIPKDNFIFNKIINLLINKINDNRIQNPEIPILIHCSAGVGRTGTFIAICQIIKCLEKIKILKKEPILNVFNVVRKLREQRYSMVTDTIQYKSIYTLCINWIKENIYKNIHNIEYNLHK